MKEDPAAILRELWNDAKPQVYTTAAAAIPKHIRNAIPVVVNAGFIAFRYILPSQLLAKMADSSRHALALQAKSSLPGSFDARSFCKRYLAEFDRDNQRVLGGSGDPFVGNIAREPQMDKAWLAVGRRRQSGGAELVAILSYAQEHPHDVMVLLQLTLVAIADRLSNTKIDYPRPNRIALATNEALIASFLEARTGGRRLQAVAAALFDTIGKRFGLFESVEVGHVNKADAARGDVADLSCGDSSGRIVLSVEVKDRKLTVREVEDTLRAARNRGIAEIIYLIRGGVSPEVVGNYKQLKERQFAAGHNVYEIEFEALLRACLILFGEPGRLVLLEAIGTRVDAHCELVDRRAWEYELQQV